MKVILNDSPAFISHANFLNLLLGSDVKGGINGIITVHEVSVGAACQMLGCSTKTMDC